MLRHLPFLVGFLWLIVFSGCTGRGPSADDFVGTWVVTRESRSLLLDEPSGTAGKIILERSGAFVAEAVPSGLIYSVPGMSVGTYISGSGDWRFGQLDGDDAILLTFRALKGNTEYKVPNGTQLLVDNISKEETLYFFLGDPDEGKRVSFRKAR